MIDFNEQSIDQNDCTLKYSLLVLSYFKAELGGKSNGGNTKNGTVIDITGS